MPGGGTFGDPIRDGRYLLDSLEVEAWAVNARETFEAAFLRKCPDDTSEETWLARLHECAAEGLWDDEEMAQLEEEADQLAGEAYARVISSPVDPRRKKALERAGWGSDDDGNWFTLDAAIKATEAGQMYENLGYRWKSRAEYWDGLQKEFEADPEGFVARVLNGESV
jgi:hypothetical protein